MGTLYVLIHVQLVLIILKNFKTYKKGTWNNTINQTCVDCNLTLNNCIECSNSTKCELCESNYYLNSESADTYLCTDICPSGK